MATDQLARAIPREVRDFADRSVEQAKRAFGGFMGAVTEAMQSEPAVASASSLNLSRLAVDFAQRNVQGAFDLARDMVHARDFSQVLELQRQFLETQMRALKSQMRTLGPAPEAHESKPGEGKAD
jgi:hypothetical protein